MDDGRPALERFIVENRNLATGIAGGALLIGLILGALIASSVLDDIPESLDAGTPAWARSIA